MNISCWQVYNEMVIESSQSVHRDLWTKTTQKKKNYIYVYKFLCPNIYFIHTHKYIYVYASQNCAFLSVIRTRRLINVRIYAHEQGQRSSTNILIKLSSHREPTPSMRHSLSNAKIGRDYNSWKGVLGRHGVGKINDNSLLLLGKFEDHGLWISNTLLRLA